MNKRTSVLVGMVLAGMAFACAPAQDTRQPAVTLDASESVETSAKVQNAVDYKVGKLIFKENFDSDLSNWIIETPASPNSSVGIVDQKLVIDVDGGCTVWLNKKLSGNILITYTRKVLVDGGKNDRLSDLNQFWMASDPNNSNLFTRTGVFKEYDPLLMYYVGVGGNTNSTTRFRKYAGTGERVLHQDLQDKEHLLEPNKEYRLKTIVYNGVTKFFVDDKEYFSYRDPEPLREGYFGFRTTESRHEIDNLEIYSLK